MPARLLRPWSLALLLLGCAEEELKTGLAGTGDDGGAEGADGADGGADGADGAGPTDDDGDGYTSDVDCDDGDRNVNPGATEVCNGIDDDCDALTDDADPDRDPASTNTYAQDADGDSYGDLTATVSACRLPAGASLSADDCDDGDPAVNPGASEVCDGLDNDCDRRTDDADPSLDQSTELRFFLDVDGDGHGDPATSAYACAAPAGSVATGDDCDDADRDLSPSAAEVCDGVDNDCDALIDDDDPGVDLSAGRSAWTDADLDTYGDPATGSTVCTVGPGQASRAGDCDDADPGANPGEVEVCGGADEDCDGLTDDADPSLDLSTRSAWYADLDLDTHGDPAARTLACAAPAGAVGVDGDCDDLDAGVNPAANEVCDSIDNDCDGLTDDADTDLDLSTTDTFFADLDADGYGDTLYPIQACALPADASTDDTDCDDARDDVSPGAPEVCDGADNDCDALVDSADADVDLGTARGWYPDADGDNHGDPSGVTLTSCDQPPGHALEPDDCDDGDAAVSPSADEVCDLADNDCDGLTDDADPGVDRSTGSPAWRDADGDGHGDPSRSTMACATPSGFAASATDCDDADRDVNPDADEVCDAADNDCDGLTDDADPGVLAATFSTFSADADLDGYGDPSGPTVAACAAPTGFSASSTDCDDGDSAVNPGADEICDLLDNDCDALTDDADPGVDLSTGATFYGDLDGDGDGNVLAAFQACAQPPDAAATGTDCDDEDPTVFPAATEVCDGVDNDCDGLTDLADPTVDTSSLPTWYTDADGDDFGDPTTGVVQCSAPAGAVLDATDCDDGDAAISPAAEEVCDSGVDNNCDGLADDADPALRPGSRTTWYVDGDGDGYGPNSSAVQACAAPASGVRAGGDCNDGDVAVYPTAPEVCDGVDNDCDGLRDDQDPGLVRSTATAWYLDSDRDGYGRNTAFATQCVAPSGTSAVPGDCNDANARINPGAIEVCDTYVDNDCDGLADDADPGLDTTTASAWYADSDSDGYGDSATSLLRCVRPTGYIATGADCDDGNAAVRPGAAERCDGIDNDCDSLVDDADPGRSDPSATVWYPDADSDGYGDPLEGEGWCAAPGAGWTADDSDCDDDRGDAYPGAEELCNGEDEDCDGDIDEDRFDDDLNGATPADLSFNGTAAHLFLGADGYAHLTSGANTWEAATVFYTSPVPAGRVFLQFEAFFGNSTGGADGIAVVFADATDFTWVNGAADDFGIAGLGGYAVIFDTYQNPGDPSGNFAAVVELDPAGAPSVLDSTTSIPTLEDGLLHDIEVMLHEGLMEVWIDGQALPVLEVPLTGFALDEVLVGIGGGTGGLSNYQSVDDLRIGCEP